MNSPWPMETITLTMRAPTGRVEFSALTAVITRWLREELHLGPMDASVMCATIEPRYEPQTHLVPNDQVGLQADVPRAICGEHVWPEQAIHPGDVPTCPDCAEGSPF